jgi:hypothetical protein
MGVVAADDASDDASLRDPPRRGTGVFAILLFLIAAAFFAKLEFGNLGYPLLWQDEGETAMFAQRVRDFGFPKVHADGNVVYGMGIPLEQAVDPDSDAYLGSLWGQYYFAAIAVGLAEGVGDLHAKTARLRLPFALVGTAGLVLFFLAISPLFGGGWSRSLLAFAIFLFGCTLSISLLLHIREVRYYALAVALSGALVALEFWRGRGISEFANRTGTALGLFALFNVFYPAAVSIGAWIGIESILARGRTEKSSEERLPAIAKGIAPVFVAGVACIPIVVYFRMAELGGIFSERWNFGPELYLENLRLIGHFLIRYEMLLPLIGLRFAMLALAAYGRPAPQRVDTRIQRSNSLLLLGAIFVLVGARNPVFFERYFVVLSPLVVAIVLLDAYSVLGWVRAISRQDGTRLLFVTSWIGIAVLVMASSWLRLPEIVGRLQETTRPYLGPIDFVIADLADRHPGTDRLSIATNYEAEPFMYYLGARVVGRFHSSNPDEIARERDVEVDVVVPRRAQPKQLRRLSGFLDRSEFEPRSYPVLDLPYNNIPELFRGRVLPETHRFQTATTENPDRQLVIWERRSAGPANQEGELVQRAGESEPE